VATGFAISGWRWPTFPPKKTDEALLQTLEEIHVWTRDNGRQLKKNGSAMEKRYLKFLNNHKKRIEDTPDLGTPFQQIDAMLATSDPGPAAENLMQTMSEIRAWATENVGELQRRPGDSLRHSLRPMGASA
jgi:hypothetical protein